MASLIDNYHRILNKNNIKLETAQEQILLIFAQLHQEITEYYKYKKNIIKKILKKKELPKGIYLYGSVGTGKSMLTDLFFENLTTAKKHKIHFHSFMLEVHNYLHNLKQNNATKNINPLKIVAQYLKEKYQVLYIDELYINDITDAMIVGKLFQEMLNQNIIIIITSNFAPQDLYKDGLQRDSFLPFISLIENNLQIIKMNSNYDYRVHKIKALETIYYIYKEKIDSQKFILENFNKFSNNAPVKNYLLNIDGRELLCPITSLDCAVFTFDQLCRSPLASSDYIAICEKFNVIFLSEIPELTPDEHNELRRFIHLIDTIYEFKRILICSAKTEINSIYSAGKWHFEFLRTASRLRDMQSEDYLKHLNAFSNSIKTN